MNCIIVDDISADRAVIERFCQRSELFSRVKGFEEPTHAIKYMREQHVDVIFLDIHMPKLSGFDFLNTLQSPPSVIFVSNDDATAPRAFDFDAVDFLLKPVSFKRFLQAVQKIADYRLANWNGPQPGQHADELFIKVGSQYLKLKLDEILCIEALGDYVKFITTDDDHVVHSTMKKTMENLPEHSFLKVHRSFIVNIHHVNDIAKNTLEVDGKTIPVSKTNRDILKDKLNIQD